MLCRKPKQEFIKHPKVVQLLNNGELFQVGDRLVSGGIYTQYTIYNQDKPSKGFTRGSMVHPLQCVDRESENVSAAV